MATRDHVVLWINGQRREVHGDDAFLNLSDYLRQSLGLTGTKIVCSEGDCGSCTVLVGRRHNGSISYRPLDACLRFMFQLDGQHVVTVEGLSAGGKLTPIQRAMVDCHGSQCGFCTPGFVMAMTGLCEQHLPESLSEDDWRHALTGNLCRCTGYSPILAAGRAARAACGPSLEQLYPTGPLLSQLLPLSSDTLELRDGGPGTPRLAHCPNSLDEALRIRRDAPTAKVIAGATDVGVQWNKRSIAPTMILDLNRIAELEGVRVEEASGQRAIVAGARATWTELLEVCRVACPPLAEIIKVFGAPQIRHVGTLGGNIVNASPIADSLPFLYVMEAELELASAAGRRQVNVNDFYRGYKQFDLRPDELLARVRVPLPAGDELLRLFKVSRRRDLDIATFTAAVRLRLDGARIADAALAYGAVGPTVLRLRKTEEFLRGRLFDEATLRTAGDLAVDEVSPIDDVRGSAEYRRQLARNVLLKLFFERQAGLLPGGAGA